MTQERPRRRAPSVPLAYLDDRRVETPLGPVTIRTLAASGLEDEAHRLGQRTFDAPLIRAGYYGGYPAVMVERDSNPYLSKVAIDRDGNLVGFYFVGIVGTARLLNAELDEYVVDPDVLEDHRLLNGMSLAVEPAWRGAGVGRLLRDDLDRSGFDAVLGIAVVGLDNLPHWLRHRTLMAYGAQGFLTARGLGGRRFAFEVDTLPAGLVRTYVEEARKRHAAWKLKHDDGPGMKKARLMLGEIAVRRDRDHPFATEENARLIAETVGLTWDEVERIQAEALADA